MTTASSCSSPFSLSSSPLILRRFGGTDGQFHYNDTWSFDVLTRKWSELQCTGLVPAPREGHAAALVGDVMYVFGGRGVDGTDLGDLTAYKLSSRWFRTHVLLVHIRNSAHRWSMFQNMGPSPSGRSGHVMASHGIQVFVLGGESSAGPQADEAALIHVLDTSTYFCHFIWTASKVEIQHSSSTRNPDPALSIPVRCLHQMACGMYAGYGSRNCVAAVEREIEVMRDDVSA